MKKIIISLLLISILLLTGCEGARSISGTSINENGELIVTYSDGTEENLGVVVGKDGADGKDGIDGKDGVDGKDGIDGKDGVNGKDGVDGKDGANGKDGIDGKDGVDGKNGADGKDGVDGKDGINVGGVDQFEITVNSGESSTVNATSKALLSSVSVVCSYASEYKGSDPAYSSGSGVIYTLDKVNGDALIITNYHVVFSNKSGYKTGISDNIQVFLYGNEYADGAIEATYVGGSLTYDIAILQVDNSELLYNSNATAISLANSDNVSLGEDAIAIGNAEGMRLSVTKGIISVISEYIDMVGADDSTELSLRMMRMDTSVNHGNSGGGLFNKNGDLIGIVSAKLIAEDIEGIGYAIPSNLVVALVDNIIYNCLDKDCQKIQKALLGITVSVSSSSSVYNPETGLVSIKETIYVLSVNDTSSLFGKLLENDVIVSVSVGDRAIELTRQYQLLDILLYAKEGDTVSLGIQRTLEDGTLEDLTIEVEITSAHINSVE